MNIIALIPAKLNSKSIPYKNLIKIKKRSLIEITIDEALKSKKIDKIFLSSESLIINKICLKKRVEFFKRNKKYSLHSALSKNVVAEFIKKNKINKETIIIYLQPTSPLRTSKHINNAINIFTKRYLPVVSVKKIDKSIFKSVFFKKGLIESTMKRKNLSANRQSFPDLYLPNGAIYIFKVKSFLKNNDFPISGAVPYIMDAKSSIDIDQYKDLKVARKS